MTHTPQNISTQGLVNNMYWIQSCLLTCSISTDLFWILLQYVVCVLYYLFHSYSMLLCAVLLIPQLQYVVYVLYYLFHSYSMLYMCCITYSTVIGQFIYGNVKERRRWDRRSHFIAMAHLKAELWLVRWYQNKHGGPNESNKVFENKCYLLCWNKYISNK